MTMTTGGSKFARAARAAMSRSVPTTVSWALVVPQRTSATGVEAGRPCAISSRVIRGRLSTPISTTSVSEARASRAQSTLDPCPEALPWPVTTVNEDATPRWVTGIPA
jgi:hypothetical protein